MRVVISNFETVLMKKINRSQFAELCGVSRMAITNACRDNGLLVPCALPDKSIHLDHPAALEYMRNKDVDDVMLANYGLKKSDIYPRQRSRPKTGAKKKAEKEAKAARANTYVEPEEYTDPKPSPTLPPVFGSDYKDVDLFLDMSLREITDVFGTDDSFKRWLDARRIIEDIKLKEIQAASKRGEYIPRHLVEQHVFPFIDNAFMRLVEDLPETLSSQLYNKIQSGYELHDITHFVRDSISKVLRGLKDNTTRVLNNNER